MEDDFGTGASGTSPSGGEEIDELKRDLAEEETTQLNVEIPVSLHRQLKMRSVETGKEMKEIVRAMLGRYLSD